MKANIRQIYTNNLFLNYGIVYTYVTVLQLLLIYQIFNIVKLLKLLLFLYTYKSKIINA
jgi:hypothetical protein